MVSVLDSVRICDLEANVLRNFLDICLTYWPIPMDERFGKVLTLTLDSRLFRSYAKPHSP